MSAQRPVEGSSTPSQPAGRCVLSPSAADTAAPVHIEASTGGVHPHGVVLHVEGVVEHGDERGRLLGFPTANIALASLSVHERHAVRDGVWAGTVQLDPPRADGFAGGGESRGESRDESRGEGRGEGGGVHVAVISVGHRPTYYGRHGERLLEAHLLDFAGDLYGRSVLVRLHERLRPQRRFAGPLALVEQLRRDVVDTRAWAVRAGLGALPQSSADQHLPANPGHSAGAGGAGRKPRIVPVA
ncbi:riboflavin kinase [Kineococcus sp. SYSU DK006]|uniref:riboflavin kinase n=1 Tax=Kineococcus sp. SYSU DK006 TaxID=3383127 RepID=UPI003D7EEC59